MKALILAAGRGTRISRFLNGKPKCIVDIRGIELIRYTVELLKKKGISNIGVVLGYQAEMVKGCLFDKKVEFFTNPFFDVTNSIASVWFAKNFFSNDDDYLIMNGDVFLEERIIIDVLKTEVSPVMYADESRKEEADYKFYYENNVLKKYGKNLTGEDITGEYIGIARLNCDFIPKFLSKLDQMIDIQQHSLWWENVLYELTKESNIFVQDIRGMFWAEVDYIEDYFRIMNYRDSQSYL